MKDTPLKDVQIVSECQFRVGSSNKSCDKPTTTRVIWEQEGETYAAFVCDGCLSSFMALCLKQGVRFVSTPIADIAPSIH